jgi:23S rRNA pseudouridine1911/1915/1917 synthase
MSDPVYDVDLEIPAGLGVSRLDRVLEMLVPERTKSQLQKLVRKGSVKIDKERVVRSNVRVRAGQRLRIQLEDGGAKPKDLSHGVRVIHSDDHLAVLDKPCGLLVHATERLVGGETFADAAEHLLGPLPTTYGAERPGIVHRLDRHTSGLLVVARDEETFHALKELFKRGEVEKRYLALVAGSPPPDEFACHLPIGPQPNQPDRQMAEPPSGGKRASTRFRVLERFGDHSLLECLIETGRRHQIRVHLFEHGLQVVGEGLYRVKDAPKLPEGCPKVSRQALHASELSFVHPATKTQLTCESEPRAEMTAALEWLRKTD